MHCAGAAIVWLLAVAPTAKLEGVPYASSFWLVAQLGAPPVPPGAPSLSTIPVTVSTSGYAAGTVVAKSRPLFMAATTYVTPAAAERQIARCSASLFVLPQLLSLLPAPPRLMFATLMFKAAAFCVTQ